MRKFHEALECAPKGTDKKATESYRFYEMINQLFEIEREMVDIHDYEEIQKIRQEKSKPIVEQYFLNAEEVDKYAVNRSHLKTALSYSLNQKDKLMYFLEDGRVELSNNRCERAVKPFTIGRKNWLFMNAVMGAKSSAAIYSIIERAKANQLVPQRYMEYLLSHLSTIDLQNTNEIEKVLPWSKELPKSLYRTEKS